MRGIAGPAVVLLAAAGCVPIVETGSWTPPSAAPAEASEARLAPAGDLRNRVRASALARLSATGVPDPADLFSSASFIRRVFAEHGVDLPGDVFALFKVGKPRWRSELKPGDIVFFETRPDGGPTHPGIFVGAGKFIHVIEGGSAFATDDLPASPWKEMFLAGRDVLSSR